MYSSYSVAAGVCSVVFPVLATSAVLLRLRARKIESLSYGADDLTISIFAGIINLISVRLL